MSLDGIRVHVLQKVFTQCIKMLDPEGTEYSRIFGDGGTDFDFSVSSPADLEILVVRRYVKLVRFGTGQFTDIKDRDLIPAIFIENGSEGYLQNFRGIEQAKEGELVPVIIRLLTMERRPTVRQRSELPLYKYSNPIFVSDIREQLDYLLDRNEFIGISTSRVGYSLPSQVYDARIRMHHNLQGVRAPYEVTDFRFEVLFDKQKEIDTRF